MAKIPTLNEQQRLRPSGPVSITSSGRARIVGEGQQALARGISQAGTGLQAAVNANQDKIRRQRVQKANRLYSEGTRTARSESYKENTFNDNGEAQVQNIYSDKEAKIREKVLKGAGLDESGTLTFTQFADGIHRSTMNGLESGKLNLTQAESQRLNTEADSITLKQMQDDPDNGFMLSKTRLSEFETNERTSMSEIDFNKQITKMKQDHANFTADGMMKASVHSDRAAEIALEELLLSGKPGEKGQSDMSMLFKGMTPKDRSKWIDDFQRTIKRKKRERAESLSSDMKDFSAASFAGLPVDQQYDALLQKIDAGGHKPKVKARLTVQAVGIKAAGEYVNRARGARRVDLGSMFSKGVADMRAAVKQVSKVPGAGKHVDQNFAEAIIRQNMSKMFSAQQGIIAEQDHDFADYAVRTFPEVRLAFAKMQDAAETPGGAQAKEEYVNILDQKRKEIGVHPNNDRLITRAQSADLGFRLSATDSPDIIQGEMKKITDFWGDKSAARVFKTLVKDGTVKDSSFLLASDFHSLQSRTEMIRMIKQGPDIKVNFEQTHPGETADEQMRKTATRMAEFNSALHATGADGNSPLSAALHKNVNFRAMELRNKDASMSAETGADQAALEIIDANWASVDQGGIKKGRLLVPRYDSEGKPRGEARLNRMDDFVEAFKDISVLREIVGDIPPEFESTLEQISSIYQGRAETLDEGFLEGITTSPEGLKNTRYLHLISKGGEWKLDDVTSNFILTIGGRSVPSKKFQEGPDGTRTYEPVMMTFNQAADHPATVEHSRTFWNKYGGVIGGAVKVSIFGTQALSQELAIELLSEEEE